MGHAAQLLEEKQADQNHTVNQTLSTLFQGPLLLIAASQLIRVLSPIALVLWKTPILCPTCGKWARAFETGK